MYVVKFSHVPQAKFAILIVTEKTWQTGKSITIFHPSITDYHNHINIVHDKEILKSGL